MDSFFQSDVNLGPFPLRSQKCIALSCPKVSSAQGPEVGQPRLVFSRHQPREPQQIPPAFHLPRSSFHATSPLRAFVAGNLPYHSFETFTPFLDLAPQQRGTVCFMDGAGWHTFPHSKAFASLPIHTLKTQLHFISFLLWASGFQQELNLPWCLFDFPSHRFWFMPSVHAYLGWCFPSPLLVEGKS